MKISVSRPRMIMPQTELVTSIPRCGLPYIVVHNIERRPVVVVIHSPIRTGSTEIEWVRWFLPPRKQRYML